MLHKKQWHYTCIQCCITPMSIVFFVLFIAVLFIEQFSYIDVWIQSYLFIPSNNTWLISREEHLGVMGFFLYRGYKKFLIFSGIASLLLWIYYTWQQSHIQRRVVLAEYTLALIFVPLIISLLKKITNVHCPNQLSMFGGILPYFHIFDVYPKQYSFSRGYCFPAGHASSGFFLFILYYCVQIIGYARYKWIALSIATLMGIATGVYQMARGEHFLTHTLATAILAWIIVTWIGKCIPLVYSLKDTNNTIHS